MQTFNHQGKADQQQEAQRQNLDGGMFLYKAAQWASREDHHACRNNHSEDHDLDMVHHANRGNDRIKREDDIQQHNLNDHTPERRTDLG